MDQTFHDLLQFLLNNLAWAAVVLTATFASGIWYAIKQRLRGPEKQILALAMAHDRYVTIDHVFAKPRHVRAGAISLWSRSNSNIADVYLEAFDRLRHRGMLERSGSSGDVYRLTPTGLRYAKRLSPRWSISPANLASD